MAIYGVSFYGEDKYGPPTYVDFSVGDFIAEPTGYDAISLSWASPQGAWDRIRLLRNWAGFAVDEDDGEIMLESTGAVASAIDGLVRPGAWHYYTLWIEASGTWYRAGLATTLMLKDHGFATRLFESLPLYHRFLQGVTDDLPPVENQTLKDFLSVLGMGLDYIKTYYDAMRVLNDPMKNHLSQLVSLGEQLGVTYEPVSPAHLFRSRVQNAVTLGREKGTLEQIRSVIGMTVGWNIEASIGPNMMLNEDAASFVHPSYDQWDAATNYAATERVSYNGYVYQAKTGGAYGTAQAPSGTNSDNTWWTWTNGTVDTTLVDSSGAVAGWKSQSYTTGVDPGTYSTAIGVGVQSATDDTVSTANALMLANKSPSATTADLGVHSTAGSSTDPLQAIQRGVPLPRLGKAYDATVTYAAGSLVTYTNHTYRATQQTVGVAPSGTSADNASWLCVGYDNRMQFTGSVYVKGGTGYQDRLAYPIVEYFDEHGALIAKIDTSADLSTNVFDPFTTGAGGGLSGRTTPVGASAWTTQSGHWMISGEAYVYPTASGSLSTISGAADGQVAVTFDTSPSGSQTQALVFRAASGTSYLMATRTGLYTSAAGTDTLVGTYSTPFKDGDRIVVSFTGSSITVYRNGTSVLTATNSTNSTSTQHGILVR